jgi:hypothetical protein
MSPSYCIFFNWYSGGWSPIGSTRHCGHQWPIVPASGGYDDGEIGGMIGRGNRSTRRKPAPMPLCPPQTPHAARARTRAATVGSQRLTAWATARPSYCIRLIYMISLLTFLLFKILLLMHSTCTWGTRLYILVETHRRFGPIYFLQGRRVRRATKQENRNNQTFWWYPYTTLYGVISQKTTVWNYRHGLWASDCKGFEGMLHFSH